MIKNGFDLGSLSWVKGEIGLALERAKQALVQFKQSKDLTELRFCRTHVHQVHGALDIIDLPALPLITDAQENLLTALENGSQEASETCLQVLFDSIDALHTYLDQLATGVAESTTVLTPILAQLYLAQGKAKPSEAALFFPEIKQPEQLIDEVDVAEETNLDQVQRSERLKESRKNFQHGLLNWLRLPAQDEKARIGLNEMIDALNQVKKIVKSPAQRVFWKIAIGLLHTLAKPEFADNRDARQLCSMIDLQLRRTQRGSERVAERVIREALYFIAQVEDGYHELIDQLKAAYGLHSHINQEQLQNDSTQTRIDNSEDKLNIIKEASAYLSRIEQVLDQYFRNMHKAEHLAAIDSLLNNVAIVFAELNQTEAADEIQEIGLKIQEMLALEVRPEREVFNQIACRISSVGFYIELLKTSDISFQTYLEESQQPKFSAIQIGEDSLEVELAERYHEIRKLLERIETSGTEDSHEKIKGYLKKLQQDANLIGDVRLQEQVNEAYSLLKKQNKEESVQVSDVAEAPIVHSEVSPALGEVDTELLSIFLEEADEVLESMRNNLSDLLIKPDDLSALTVIRRGTHTLKGSGRMVGLSELGETAWEIEQTLNLQLRQEKPVDAIFIDMLQQAAQLLQQWIDGIKQKQAPPDVAALIKLSRDIREEAADNDPINELIENVLPKKKPQQVIGSILAGVSNKQQIRQPEESAVVDSEKQIPQQIYPSKKPEHVESSTKMGVVSSALHEAFVREVAEHLTSLKSGLDEIKHTDGMHASSSLIRAAHTLAGAAGTLNALQIIELSRAIEHALERYNIVLIQKKSRGIADLAGEDVDDSHAKEIGLLQKAVHYIEELVEQITQSGNIEIEESDAKQVLLKQINTLYPVKRKTSQKPDATAQIKVQKSENFAAEVEFSKASPEKISQEDIEQIDSEMFELFILEAKELCSGFNLRLNEWRIQPTNQESSNGLYRLLHTFKGGARMVGAMQLGDMAHQIETVIQTLQSQSEVPNEAIESVQAQCDDLAEYLEAVYFAINSQSDSAQENTSTSPEIIKKSPDLLDDSLRVSTNLLDRMVDGAGEMAITFNGVQNEFSKIDLALQELDDGVVRLRRYLKEIETQGELGLRGGNIISQSIVEKLDFDPLELEQFTHFQETVRMMAESVDDIATIQRSLGKDVEQANHKINSQIRLNRGVQQVLMDTRMLPMSSLEDRLQRIVRQAARDTQKLVQLVVSGGDIQLDRAILERMMPPFEHMLRNAVSHGIESDVERQKSGKAKTGTINIRVERDGNKVLLVLADDGVGLNLERLRKKAESLGLVHKNAELDETQQCELIFLPGLSTADQITQVAGRGIGMDVVRNEVSSLGGSIEIASVPGRGVTIRIHLPLTLALMQALICRVDQNIYAVPSSMIVQIVEDVHEVIQAQLQERKYMWRDQSYPFYFLPHLLGDSLASPEKKSKHYKILLLCSGSHQLAILVDEIIVHQETVVKNIGPQLANVIGIDGATVLGDGRIVLIINPVILSERLNLGIYQEEESKERSVISNQVPVADKGETKSDADLTDDPRPLIMIVDDSLTVRKVSSRLLEREGYRVVTARDGAEALNELSEQRPQVVLCDIDMPRMDGFDFLRAVQTDPQLKSLPVIMITSRTAEKHQRLARELGARHYLGKPYVEADLLGLITDLLTESVV